MLICAMTKTQQILIIKALNDRAASLASQVGQAASFIVPEILSIDEATIEQFINEHDGLEAL